jgi:hypothetical protein
MSHCCEYTRAAEAPDEIAQWAASLAGDSVAAGDIETTAMTTPLPEPAKPEVSVGPLEELRAQLARHEEALREVCRRLDSWQDVNGRSLQDALEGKDKP